MLSGYERMVQVTEMREMGIDYGLAVKARQRIEQLDGHQAKHRYNEQVLHGGEGREDPRLVIRDAVTLALQAGLSLEQVGRYLDLGEAQLSDAVSRQAGKVDQYAVAETLLRRGTSMTSVAEQTGLEFRSVRRLAEKLGVERQRQGGGKVPTAVLRDLDGYLNNGVRAAEALALVKEAHGADAAALTINNVYTRASRLRRTHLSGASHDGDA